MYLFEIWLNLRGTPGGRVWETAGSHHPPKFLFLFFLFGEIQFNIFNNVTRIYTLADDNRVRE